MASIVPRGGGRKKVSEVPVESLFGGEGEPRFVEPNGTGYLPGLKSSES